MILKSPGWRVVMVAGVIALTVSACGRRGPPQPPGAAAPEATVQQSQPTFGAPTPGARAEPDIAPPVAPDRPFVLDILL
ncbi:MAG: hypothetical protein EA385_11275 [Salinarimonadaceae bacterium]|nr:MAG: hypothetical protein EA385_11275 [Salinarimonadaceae bacterium]